MYVREDANHTNWKNNMTNAAMGESRRKSRLRARDSSAGPLSEGYRR